VINVFSGFKEAFRTQYDMWPLHQARDVFLEAIIRGEKVECPCCRREEQAIKSRLYWRAVKALTWFVRYNQGNRWTHVKNEMPSELYDPIGGLFAKLRFWGFIEQRPTTATDVCSKGYWRALKPAWDFLLRQVSVPAAVFTLNKRAIGFSRETVDCVEAMGENFDINDVLYGAAHE
jgi:hypothetical protein